PLACPGLFPLSRSQSGLTYPSQVKVLALVIRYERLVTVPCDVQAGRSCHELPLFPESRLRLDLPDSPLQLPGSSQLPGLALPGPAQVANAHDLTIGSRL